MKLRHLTNAVETGIFLVEGDSAKQARKRETQAVRQRDRTTSEPVASAVHNAFGTCLECGMTA